MDKNIYVQKFIWTNVHVYKSLQQQKPMKKISYEQMPMCIKAYKNKSPRDKSLYEQSPICIKAHGTKAYKEKYLSP